MAAATAGAPGAAIIERADGTTQSALKDVVMLKAGDRVRMLTGGGGGYGDPKRRSRDRVLTDLARGYISTVAACEVYGLDEPSPPCVYRRSNSAILVVKSTENRLRNDGTEALNSSMNWGVLI